MSHNVCAHMLFTVRKSPACREFRNRNFNHCGHLDGRPCIGKSLNSITGQHVQAIGVNVALPYTTPRWQHSEFPDKVYGAITE